MKRMTFTDLRLDWLMERGAKLSQPSILLLSAVLLAVAAIADWLVGHISLGVLYILPMMLAALVLEPLELAALALFSAFLRSRFDYPGSDIEIALRFAFASVSYFTCGLFVAALASNRKLVKEHLGKIQREQALRKEAEDQLRLLVASSPAAILTLNEHGTVLAANKAADSLFAIPDNQSMQGRGIEKYLPVLSDALHLKNVPEGFRTAAQCTGYRSNGEIFQAHTWFSSYAAPEGTRLAAIVVDSSEEMRDREEQNLRQLVKSNRIVASVVSHELRNLCGAISLLCSHLNEKHALAGDEDFLGIISLVKGLEKVALLELHSQEGEPGGCGTCCFTARSGSTAHRDRIGMEGNRRMWCGGVFRKPIRWWWPIRRDYYKRFSIWPTIVTVRCRKLRAGNWRSPFWWKPRAWRFSFKIRVRESSRPTGCFSRSRLARTEPDWDCFSRGRLCEATEEICDLNRI